LMGDITVIKMIERTQFRDLTKHIIVNRTRPLRVPRCGRQ
jgi:hypothetical protein